MLNLLIKKFRLNSKFSKIRENLFNNIISVCANFFHVNIPTNYYNYNKLLEIDLLLANFIAKTWAFLFSINILKTSKNKTIFFAFLVLLIIDGRAITFLVFCSFFFFCFFYMRYVSKLLLSVTLVEENIIVIPFSMVLYVIVLYPDYNNTTLLSFDFYFLHSDLLSLFKFK